MQRVCIPDYEYKERIQKAAKMLRERNLEIKKECYRFSLLKILIY